MKKNRNNRKGNIIPFPNLEERLLNKGMEALQEKRFKDALQTFNQYSTYHSGTPEVEVGIVVCLFELGLYEDAKEKCERLLQYDIGDYFTVLQIYITILIQLSEYDKVVSILEALFEEERVPREHAGELFHLLEFSRKSTDSLMGVTSRESSIENVDVLGQQLITGNVNEQLQAIQTLRQQTSIKEIISDLKEVMANDTIHPITKSLVLQLMTEKEIQEPIIVNKFGRTTKVHPGALKNIFEERFAISVLNKLDDILGHENPTLFEATKELWERVLFVFYPFLPEPENHQIWAGALHKYGYNLFGIDISNEELEHLYNTKMEQIESACQQISDIEKISIIDHES